MNDETDHETGAAAPAERGSRWREITLVVMALLGAAVLASLTITLAEANHQRDRALRLQSHSYDVMILARTLSGTIARSEASLGRYVISTDQRLGRLYFADWRLAGQQIDRLDRLTLETPTQRAPLARLRGAYADRGSELSTIALSTRYAKNDQALSRYYQSRSAPSLVAINRALDDLTAAERMLLQARTAEALAAVEGASNIAKVLAVFGLLIVAGAVALAWMTVHALGERALAEADAAVERARTSELRLAVAQAADDLRAQEAKLHQIQKMEAVGQLTGGIAHDFNNMLAVVMGGLELARRGLVHDPASVARHIDNATEGAARAAALTRRLLAFSREDSLRPEAIEATGLVAGMRDLLDRTLGDAITVVTLDDGRGWHVRADRVQLENALLNLGVNARDAMDGRGTLTIATGGATLAAGAVGDCAAGDHVTVAVSDTGCGMTPEIVARVFEPFFTTKPAGKGTGLGLSQIFGLVRQLGGEIAIASAPGAGTTVTLYLPRDHSVAAKVAGEPVAVPAPARPIEPAATPAVVDRNTTPGRRVLVVEDDPRVLAATMGALGGLGHRATACEDPLAAAAMLASANGTGDPFDLVISDVLMPGRTGPEMVAELLRDFPHLAVLFVTGYAGDTSGAGLGGHHVLRKPFTLAGLAAAIAAAVNPRDGAERIAAE